MEATMPSVADGIEMSFVLEAKKEVGADEVLGAIDQVGSLD